MQAIKSLVVALCVISLAFAENSPVFLWGANSVAKPSFGTIHRSEFAELIKPLLADNTLVVFLQKALNNKDFLCTNYDNGKSCFAHLQGVNLKTYYASVENPVEALLSLGGEHEYNSVDESGKFANPLVLSNGKVIFVNFDGEDQSIVRGANLQSHDAIIASVTSQLGDNVFFMYTSVPSTSNTGLLKRQRRESATNSQGYVFRDGAQLLVYFTSLSVVTDNKATVLEVNAMSVNKLNDSAMSVTLTPSNSSPLTFDIISSSGYFLMKNVKYNNILFDSSDVYSPTDFSYFCGNLTLNSFINDKQPTPHALKLNSLQFQAPFGYTDNATFVFSDPWHCVGFFTGGILSGLLIVALLLTITFIGVCWMMDINTMDRFDDPKGKTITINASD